MQTSPEEINPYSAPPHLRAAARDGDLVMFVGAGVSRLCGSPDWRGFADGMLEQLCDHTGLNFAARHQLRNIPDARQCASVAKEIWEGAGCELDFDRILHPESPRLAGLEAYRILTAIGAVFVTTNSDRWLDDSPVQTLASMQSGAPATTQVPEMQRRPVYYDRRDLTVEKLGEPGVVLHLHGSYKRPKGMVVSVRDCQWSPKSDQVLSRKIDQGRLRFKNGF